MLLISVDQQCKLVAVLAQGGCDEELSLFLYRSTVKEEVINALQGKEMGLRDHGELIKVHVVPYDKLWRSTADVKALSAIALYEMAKREGLLPQRSSQISSWVDVVLLSSPELKFNFCVKTALLILHKTKINCLYLWFTSYYGRCTQKHWL